MSAIRFSAYQSRLCVKETHASLRVPSRPSLVRINPFPLSCNPFNLSADFKYPSQNASISKSHCSMPICLAGSGGMMDGGNQGSQWTPFESSAQEKLKGQSVEDMLQQQIKNKEYYDNRGGNGGKPPRVGGSGGGGNNFGGSEGENFAALVHETIQVVVATIGFLILYVIIIDGVELWKLFNDYLHYIFSGSKSVRLRRAMYKWERFWKRFVERNDDNLDENYRRYSLKSYMVADSDD